MEPRQAAIVAVFPSDHFVHPEPAFLAYVSQAATGKNTAVDAARALMPEDAYYLQQTPDPDPNKPAQTKIVRRGNELHGPQNEMLIPRATVLFVEDLVDASPIAQFMAKDQRK